PSARPPLQSRDRVYLHECGELAESRRDCSIHEQPVWRSYSASCAAQFRGRGDTKPDSCIAHYLPEPDVRFGAASDAMASMRSAGSSHWAVAFDCGPL